MMSPELKAALAPLLDEAFEKGRQYERTLAAKGQVRAPAPPPASTFPTTDAGRYADYFAASQHGHFPGDMHEQFGMGVAPFAQLTGLLRKQVRRAGEPGWVWASRPKGAESPKPGQTFSAMSEIVKVPTQHLVADPARFQFRRGHEADGTVRPLPEEKFNPAKCKPLATWIDPDDGQENIVDGHHRLAWAERDGVQELPVRRIQAKSAEEAKKIGERLNKPWKAATFADRSGLVLKEVAGGVHRWVKQNADGSHAEEHEHHPETGEHANDAAKRGHEHYKLGSTEVSGKAAGDAHLEKLLAEIPGHAEREAAKGVISLAMDRASKFLMGGSIPAKLLRGGATLADAALITPEDLAKQPWLHGKFGGSGDVSGDIVGRNTGELVSDLTGGALGVGIPGHLAARLVATVMTQAWKAFRKVAGFAADFAADVGSDASAAAEIIATLFNAATDGMGIAKATPEEIIASLPAAKQFAATEGDDTPDLNAVIGEAMLAAAEEALDTGDDPDESIDRLRALGHDPDALEEFFANLQGIAPTTFAGGWNANDHPRGKGGHFISKDKLEDAKHDPAMAEQLRKEVRPQDREKLEAVLGGGNSPGRTKRGAQRAASASRRAAKQSTREAAEQVIQKMVTAARGARGERVTADDLHALADHLQSGHMSVADIRRARDAMKADDIKSNLGGARQKAAMVQALVAHAKGEAFERRMKEQGFGPDEIAGLTGKQTTPAPATTKPDTRTPPTTGQMGAWGRAVAEAKERAKGEAGAKSPQVSPSSPQVEEPKPTEAPKPEPVQMPAPPNPEPAKPDELLDMGKLLDQPEGAVAPGGRTGDAVARKEEQQAKRSGTPEVKPTSHADAIRAAKEEHAKAVAANEPLAAKLNEMEKQNKEGTAAYKKLADEFDRNHEATQAAQKKLDASHAALAVANGHEYGVYHQRPGQKPELLGSHPSLAEANALAGGHVRRVFKDNPRIESNDGITDEFGKGGTATSVSGGEGKVYVAKKPIAEQETPPANEVATTAPSSEPTPASTPEPATTPSPAPKTGGAGVWEAYQTASPKVKSLLDLAYQGAGHYNLDRRAAAAPPVNPERLHNSLLRVRDQATGDDRAEIQKAIDRLGYKPQPKAPIPLPPGVKPPTDSRAIRNIRRRGFSADGEEIDEPKEGNE